MIILMDDSSVSEPFLPGSGTSMNSSIISTSLLHHQADSLHPSLSWTSVWPNGSIWTELFVYIFARPESTKRSLVLTVALANTEKDSDNN